MSLRDAIRVVLVVVAFALGAWAVAQDVDGFLSALGTIGPLGGLAATALVVAGLLASAAAWRAGVAELAGHLAPAPARRVFFVGQLGKYLPGAVWTVVAQADAARHHGLRTDRMALASILFIGLHLVTGVLLVAVLLPWAAPDVLATYPWLWALLPLSLLALAPPVLTFGARLGLRLLRRDPLPAPLTARTVAVPCVWFLVAWVAYGAATVVAAAPLAGQVDLQLAAAATGGFAAAWVLGVLFLPAPAGVGAREVVLVLTLGPLLGTIEATSIAIVLRVVHTAADLGMAAWARAADRSRR